MTDRLPASAAVAYITSICEFQDSMRSCKSTASTPTLIDSTIFSLKSFSRSYSVTFCSSEAYSRRVLDRDPNVSGERFEQFDVFAGEEVSGHGLAEAKESNRLLARVAWDVVVQIKPRDRFLGFGGFARQLARVFEEDVARGSSARGLERKDKSTPRPRRGRRIPTTQIARSRHCREKSQCDPPSGCAPAGR